jgi:hypothetical protein
MVPEAAQRMRVGRHGVVIEVAADDPPQPFPLFAPTLKFATPSGIRYAG